MTIELEIELALEKTKFAKHHVRMLEINDQMLQVAHVRISLMHPHGIMNAKMLKSFGMFNNMTFVAWLVFTFFIDSLAGSLTCAAIWAILFLLIPMDIIVEKFKKRRNNKKIKELDKLHKALSNEFHRLNRLDINELSQKITQEIL